MDEAQKLFYRRHFRYVSECELPGMNARWIQIDPHSYVMWLHARNDSNIVRTLSTRVLNTRSLWTAVDILSML